MDTRYDPGLYSAAGGREELYVSGQLPVGGEILEYRIEGLVGRGGMGIVYRAYDVRLKRSLALKLVAPGAVAGRSLSDALPR